MCLNDDCKFAMGFQSFAMDIQSFAMKYAMEIFHCKTVYLRSKTGFCLLKFSMDLQSFSMKYAMEIFNQVFNDF